MASSLFKFGNRHGGTGQADTWQTVVPFSCISEFDQQDVDDQTLQIVAVQCAGLWALGVGGECGRNCMSSPCSPPELVSVSCCKCTTCFVNLGHNFGHVLWKSSSFSVNPHSLAINQSPLNAELSCCFSKHEGGCVYLQLAFP